MSTVDNRRPVLTGLLLAAAPLLAAAALIGNGLVDGGPARSDQPVAQTITANCVVEAAALDQPKYPACLGD
jgi:hypothetical protein